jgi:FkbH-like protein
MLRPEELVGRLDDCATERIAEFIRVLRHAASFLTKVSLCICPWEDNDYELAAERELWRTIREALTKKHGIPANVTVIDLSAYLPLFKVTSVFDPFAQALGGPPYTEEFFAAAAGIIARVTSEASRPLRKVIVVDCDGTLWDGSCAEDNWDGVTIGDNHLEFQRVLKHQKDKGYLLCICSNNKTQDVFDVFRNRSDMILKIEDFAACRIDWKSKPENLVSLSQELNIDLAGFIFFDDDPANCALVRHRCPEVVSLDVSGSESELALRCNHIWDFDITESTVEDKIRSTMYERGKNREKALLEAPTLDEFLATLDLQVSCSPATDADLLRVAQLTQRTTQFNVSNIRRDQNAVHLAINLSRMTCRIARAKDRFGDYGIVGVTMFDFKDDATRIDTFILSCRALGKGIERLMLLDILDCATGSRSTSVKVSMVETSRNIPARQFIYSIFRKRVSRESDRTILCEESPEEIRQMLSAKDSSTKIQMDDRMFGDDGPGSTPVGLQVPEWSRILEMAATKLNTAAKVIAAARSRRCSQTASPRDRVRPRNREELLVAEIWRDILGTDDIGVHDSFFSCGGSSLMATQMLGRIHRTTGVRVEIEAFFDNSTVETLAYLIGTVSSS